MSSVSTHQFGPFRLDAREHRLSRNGADVPLQLKAFEILCILVERSQRLLTKEELLRLVWPDSTVEENNLNKNISLLRKVLGEQENGQSYIETIPRVGYRFTATVVESDPSLSMPADNVKPVAATCEKRRQKDGGGALL